MITVAEFCGPSYWVVKIIARPGVQFRPAKRRSPPERDETVLPRKLEFPPTFFHLEERIEIPLASLRIRLGSCSFGFLPLATRANPNSRC